MKYAVLIHLLHWEYDKDEFIIDEGISFIKINNHPIGKLYNTLCRETGIDDGDPFLFYTALLLYDNTEEDYSYFPTSSPASLSSTLLNLLTLVHGGTLGHCRIISSKDDFETCWSTYELYPPLSEEVYDLNNMLSKVDNPILEQLKSICNNLKQEASKSHKNSRINNALNFFYLAWHVHTFEQTAISLSIVIETLFSPSSTSELSHQISFNLAKFYGNSKKDRLEIYKMIKKYYSMRSKLVHGESITNEEYDSIPQLFKFISSVLLKILEDGTLINLFNDNKLRREYLENNLFE